MVAPYTAPGAAYTVSHRPYVVKEKKRYSAMAIEMQKEGFPTVDQVTQDPAATIGVFEYLCFRMRERGVRSVHGVPGKLASYLELPYTDFLSSSR